MAVAAAVLVSPEEKSHSSQDWKAQLKIPPIDTRYKTEGINRITRKLLSYIKGSFERSLT